MSSSVGSAGRPLSVVDKGAERLGTRAASVVAPASRGRSVSGDEVHALVGGEEFVGGGPAVEDAHDVAAGSTHDAGGGVPQGPAQGFGFGDGEWAGEAEQLEPAHEASAKPTTASQARL